MNRSNFLKTLAASSIAFAVPFAIYSKDDSILGKIVRVSQGNRAAFDELVKDMGSPPFSQFSNKEAYIIFTTKEKLNVGEDLPKNFSMWESFKLGNSNVKFYTFVWNFSKI